MSRTIDTSDPKSLSEEDRRYLAERARLPKGAEPVQLHPDFTPLGVQVNTGTANTFGLTADELQERLDRLAELEAKEAEANRETDLEELKRQQAGLPDDDDRETYKPSEGWTDDKLKSELSRRNLSTDGSTKALRARLVKDDRDSDG